MRSKRPKLLLLLLSLISKTVVSTVLYRIRSDGQITEKFRQDVQRSDLEERDERRRVGDNGHSLSLRATVWSYSQSSWV